MGAVTNSECGGFHTHASLDRFIRRYRSHHGDIIELKREIFRGQLKMLCRRTLVLMSAAVVLAAVLALPSAYFDGVRLEEISE